MAARTMPRGNYIFVFTDADGGPVHGAKTYTEPCDTFHWNRLVIQIGDELYLPGGMKQRRKTVESTLETFTLMGRTAPHILPASVAEVAVSGPCGYLARYWVKPLVGRPITLRGPVGTEYEGQPFEAEVHPSPFYSEVGWVYLKLTEELPGGDGPEAQEMARQMARAVFPREGIRICGANIRYAQVHLATPRSLPPVAQRTPRAATKGRRR